MKVSKSLNLTFLKSLICQFPEAKITLPDTSKIVMTRCSRIKSRGGGF